MAYTIAPAARSLLTQATQRAPKRNRSHDGTVGDTAHSRRRSWHNPSNRNGDPDPNGVVMAVDLTHDPAHGIDAHGLVRALVARRDKRVAEAISNGQIWTARRAAEGWRRYTGANPHDKHAHITVTWEFRNNTDPWWPPKTVAARPLVKTPPTPEGPPHMVIVKDPKGPHQYLVHMGRRWRIASMPELTAYAKVCPRVELDAAAFARLVEA